MAKTNPRTVARAKRVRRIRKKITGTSAKPRLRVFKSNKQTGKSGAAKVVGQKIAERAKAAGIEQVVFDRGGYLYHGRVKALSEGAREGGLKF